MGEIIQTEMIILTTYHAVGNFRMVQIFLYFLYATSVCENKKNFPSLRSQTTVVWGRDHSYPRSCVDEEVYVRMALYHGFFQPVDAYIFTIFAKICTSKNFPLYSM